MSRRFDWYADDMREAPYGLWVSYEDYSRLHKAGDAMAEIIEGTYCIDKPPALIEWNAAKEERSQP
jgi:hypothetical protein